MPASRRPAVRVAIVVLVLAAPGGLGRAEAGRRLLSRGTGERNFVLEDSDNHLIAGANSYWIKYTRNRASLCPLKGMHSTPARSVSAVVLHR